jgi:aldehyde:ferredoxin oxidoreductase
LTSRRSWAILSCAAERAANLKRAFNVREGFGPDDDTLPDRMFEPLLGGSLKGVAIDRGDFAKMLDLYYDMVGWDKESGFPTPAKLAELDLDWVEDYRP